MKIHASRGHECSHLQAQGHPQAGRSRFLLTASERMSRPHLDLRPPASRPWGNTFLLFSVPQLWDFVAAALVH